MEIERLWEEDSNKVIGFWTEGHQKIDDFVEQCEIKFFDDDDDPIDSNTVVHGWVKKLIDDEILEGFDYYLAFCNQQDDDEQAIAATYFFYD